jgi:ADP-heptose:LPS heptosyltransferase
MPSHLIRYFGGIGDNLLCATVAKGICDRDPDARVWIVTRFPELFENTPFFPKVFSMEHWHLWEAPSIRSRRLFLAYTKERFPGANLAEDLPPKEHIIASMCRNAGLRGDVALRPYFTLTDDERRAGALAPTQVTVQCIGPESGAAMLNKLWDPKRFQDVVDGLGPLFNGRVKLLQVGDSRDVRLDGVVDLRGTTSLRETAAILSQSVCFVGTVGFLMHLARAVECRSVIIYGGREHSWQTGYVCNENLDSFVECSPCWKWNRCDFGRKCMELISVEQVVAAVQRVVEHRGMALETETVCL